MLLPGVQFRRLVCGILLVSLPSASDIEVTVADYLAGATFQAVSSSDRLDIVFSCGDRANNRISVDNVKVAPFNGNAF